MSKELEEIQKVYQEINSELLKRPNFNTKDNRYNTIQKIISQLKVPLKHVEHRVICDLTNNTSEVIDNNQMVAKVEWKLNKFDTTIYYIDLVF
jgi:hypothetical protein